MRRIQTLGGLAVLDGTRPLGGNAGQPRRLAMNRDRLATRIRPGALSPEPSAHSASQAVASAEAPRRPQ